MGAHSKWRVWTVTLLTVVIGVACAALELLLVFVMRGPYSKGLSWPVTLIGVLAALLLFVGYVPVPLEIAKRRGRVVGIDFIFLTMDWLGAFFSLMAIGKDPGFEVVGKANAGDSGPEHL